MSGVPPTRRSGGHIGAHHPLTKSIDLAEIALRINLRLTSLTCDRRAVFSHFSRFSRIRESWTCRLLGMKIHAYIYSLTVAGLIGAAFAADPPTTENPAAAGDGVQVGVAKRDGITVTANEVFITRNGATERLSKELVLPSGVIARPDGTMVLPDKTEATLRASQLLTLEGKVIDIPLDPNVNPAPPQKTGANAPGSAQNTQSGAAMNRNGSGTGGNAGGRLQSQNGGGAASLGDTIATSGNGVPNGNGTNANVQTFIDRNGMEFTGTINQDGSINTTDGRSIVNDGTVRTVRRCLPMGRCDPPTAGSSAKMGTSRPTPMGRRRMPIPPEPPASPCPRGISPTPIRRITRER
jgi:hypothetical protein